MKRKRLTEMVDHGKQTENHRDLGTQGMLRLCVIDEFFIHSCKLVYTLTTLFKIKKDPWKPD